MNQVVVELLNQLNRDVDSEYVIKKINYFISKDYDLYYQLIFVKLYLKENNKEKAVYLLKQFEDKSKFGGPMFINRLKKEKDIGDLTILSNDVLSIIEKNILPVKSKVCRKLF
jgi:hypothetical protein